MVAGPTSKEMILGLGLFSTSITLYSIYCMLIKVMMSTYLLSVSELNYYIAIILVIKFYMLARYQKIDVLSIPKTAQFDLLLRCVFGVLSDVLLFVAFEFTSFSKAFSLFFTSTLLAPFLGRAILGEPIKKWDIIAISMGFGGMLMLVNPLKATEPSSDISEEGKSPYSDLIGCGIAVAAAVNGALAITYIRKLAD